MGGNFWRYFDVIHFTRGLNIWKKRVGILYQNMLVLIQQIVLLLIFLIIELENRIESINGWMPEAEQLKADSNCKDVNINLIR